MIKVYIFSLSLPSYHHFAVILPFFLTSLSFFFFSLSVEQICIKDPRDDFRPAEKYEGVLEAVFVDAKEHNMIVVDCVPTNEVGMDRNHLSFNHFFPFSLFSFSLFFSSPSRFLFIAVLTIFC